MCFVYNLRFFCLVLQYVQTYIEKGCIVSMQFAFSNCLFLKNSNMLDLMFAL